MSKTNAAETTGRNQTEWQTVRERQPQADKPKEHEAKAKDMAVDEAAERHI